jgi:hypothetical protein
MSAIPKSNTIEKIRSLMTTHTAVTEAKPAAPTSVAPPAPMKPLVFGPKPELLRPPLKADRYSVRLNPQEVQKIESIALEIHQRIGKRISMAEIFRIGLLRLGPNTPITADEVVAVRAMDRRRTGTPGIAIQ